MGKTLIAAVVGYIVWTALWLGGATYLRAWRPDSFVESELITDNLLLGIMLGLSVVCSLIAGFVCGAINKADARLAGLLLAIALLLTGIGVQISVWDTMPLWYHIPFLVLLVPVTIMGASLHARD